MTADLITVFDPYRTWMAIPELTALAVLLYLGIVLYREQVMARREAGLPSDWDGLFGLGVSLALAIGVTSQVPTPAWMVLCGPTRVAEGPVEEVRYGTTPGGVMTLDLVVEGVPMHVEDRGREAELMHFDEEMGGPIRRGEHVRVSLHNQRVLKFERLMDRGTHGSPVSVLGAPLAVAPWTETPTTSSPNAPRHTGPQHR